MGLHHCQVSAAQVDVVVAKEIRRAPMAFRRRAITAGFWKRRAIYLPLSKLHGPTAGFSQALLNFKTRSGRRVRQELFQGSGQAGHRA